MQVNDPVDPPFDEQCSVPTGYVDPPGWALDPAGPFDVDPSPSLQNDNVTHFALARPAAILARAAQVLHDGTGLDALPQQQADRDAAALAVADLAATGRTSWAAWRQS